MARVKYVETIHLEMDLEEAEVLKTLLYMITWDGQSIAVASAFRNIYTALEDAGIDEFDPLSFSISPDE